MNLFQKGERVSWRLLSGGAVLALALLCSGCWAARTDHAREVLTRVFDSVSLPASLELRRIGREGSFNPLDSSGLPSEERVYRVHGDPAEVRSEVILALEDLGLSREVSRLSSRRVEDEVECWFTMKGGGVLFVGNYEKRATEGGVSAGPICPRPSWDAVFLWLRLDASRDFLS